MLRLTKHNCPLEAGKSKPASKGQSLVELALIMPLLVGMLTLVIEAGLAINAWIRVNTAARDATRFALDAGTHEETASLVLQKLAGIDFGATSTFTQSENIDVFIINITTNGYGTIIGWDVDHKWDGNMDDNIQKLTQAALQTRLDAQGLSVSRDVNITVVEVDYYYHPLLGTLMSPNSTLPMTSYAMVQKE